MKHKKIHIITWLTVNFGRLLLALVFLLSGFVKAVDPLGMSYKINDYLRSAGIILSYDSFYTLAFAVGLGIFEFLLGVGLLLGIRRRLTITCTFLFVLVMTILTAYIYIYNPVDDCGCFGEALILSHKETFIKNIVLLLIVIYVAYKNQRIDRFITERNQWILSNYSYVYIFCLSLYSAHYLPILDFTDYSENTDIQHAINSEEENSLKGFYLTSYDGSEDETFRILSDTSYTFLLIVPEVETSDDGCNDRINDLYDFCVENQIKFYGVISYNSESLADWQDRTGAAYPFLRGDEKQLRAMVRSNPGLVLLKNGIIEKKWSNNNLPELESETKVVEHKKNLPLMQLLFWFVVPLLVIILLDNIWKGRKYIKLFFVNYFNKTNMRKKIVAGNWKMNLNLQDGVKLAQNLNEVLKNNKPNCDVVICTPFIHLASVYNEIDANVIGLGAENCADKASGAYTGEVSAEMVKSTGAQYVILGHSERRSYYQETAEILKEKTKLALANGLKVIFCIGEVLEERESGKQNEVVKAQLEGSLFELTQEEFANIILAYEPVWAIGTGKTATAEQAEDMHAFIRKTIENHFGAEAANNVSILYGGSCKPSNAKEIFSKENVDGGLIGGAALNVEDFKGIIDAWN